VFNRLHSPVRSLLDSRQVIHLVSRRRSRATSPLVSQVIIRVAIHLDNRV
jgi:hypothetical protein